MKKQTLLSALVVIIMTFAAGTNRTYAQGCVLPCSGPWTYVQETFTVTTINGHIGCPYKFYLRYRYRPCMGMVQVEIDGPGLGVVIENMTPGFGCVLGCPDVPELYKTVYRHIIIARGPIVKSSPSPCYYSGTITIPPAARACFGMGSTTTLNVLVPCDNAGCCYSKLYPLGANGIQQVVVSVTPCPATPVIPPAKEISWSCDRPLATPLTFMVPFMPSMPLSCENTCDSGPYYFGGPVPKSSNTGVAPEEENKKISGFTVYPNPVEDHCMLSFYSASIEDVTLELYDLSGKLVKNMYMMASEGNQTINIDTRELQSGIYMCKLICGKEVHVGKIIK